MHAYKIGIIVLICAGHSNHLIAGINSNPVSPIVPSGTFGDFQVGQHKLINIKKFMTGYF